MPTYRNGVSAWMEGSEIRVRLEFATLSMEKSRPYVSPSILLCFYACAIIFASSLEPQILNFRASQIADCDQIMMSSQAKSCAVMNTKLLVTSTSASVSEVHRTVLLALANSLNGNKMDESIPNLTATSYIGPDPESLTLSASLANNMIESRGASTTPVIAISIGCSFLLLILALNLVFRRTSKAATAKHSPISTREEDIDDASDGPSVSYRDQIITNNS